MDSCVDEVDSSSENETLLRQTADSDHQEKLSYSHESSLSTDNNAVFRRVLGSQRTIRDVEMLMNSVYWIQALKMNNARGIGNDLYCNLTNFSYCVFLFETKNLTFQLMKINENNK